VATGETLLLVIRETRVMTSTDGDEAIASLAITEALDQVVWGHVSYMRTFRSGLWGRDQAVSGSEYQSRSGTPGSSRKQRFPIRMFVPLQRNREPTSSLETLFVSEYARAARQHPQLTAWVGREPTQFFQR
jgi:hypothetical protein